MNRESKEGWAYLLNSKSEHYFVDGRSLCRKWLGLGIDYGRTMGQPPCKACEKALAKREAKKKKVEGEKMEGKTRLRAALDSLFINQKPIPTAGGQMCGAEMWQLRFSGFMQSEVYEALQSLEAELAEARAEVERLKSEIRDNNDLATRQIIPAEMAAEDGQLEIQRLNAECNKLDTECNKWVKRLREKEEGFAITIRHRSIQVEQKDKLIEQMRDALNILVASATPSGPLWHGSAEMQLARAALSAAERGE